MTITEKRKKPNLFLNFIVAMAIVSLLFYGFKTCMTQEKDIAIKIINAPSKLRVHGILGDIEDCSTPVFRRCSLNITISDNLTNKEIEEELRYALYQAYIKRPDVGAIMVKAFQYNSNMVIASAVYAPHGSWGKADYGKDYEVKISIQ